MFSFRNFGLLTLFPVILILSKELHSQAERHVEFVATNCTFNPEYFKNFEVFVKNGSFNMDMELIKPIVRGFKVHIDYQLRIANAKNYQSIFTKYADVCGLVATLKDSLLKTWFKTIIKNSNFMNNCPVEPGFYYMRNWTLSSSMIHQFLYPGEYRARADFFYGKFNTKFEQKVLTIILETVNKLNLN